MVVTSNVTVPALAGAILLILASGSQAIAAPATVDRGTPKVAETEQVRPVAASETDEDSVSCSKSRKRLWVEGEGWVVRKVTTCR